MTEQEKQEYRNFANLLQYDQMLTGALVKEIVLKFSDALDERDREVERLNEENEGYTEFLQGWHDDYNELKEENQRLRKALEEVRKLTWDTLLPISFTAPLTRLVNEALNGEELE